MAPKTVTVEYVWIGGSTDNWSLRSKTRVYNKHITDINQYRIKIALEVSVIDDITKFTNITFVFGSDGTVIVENI